MSAADGKPFSFDWRASSETEKQSDAMGAPFGDVPSNPADPATTQAHEILEAARKSRKPGRRSREEIAAETQRQQEQFAKEYEQLFNPEVWGGICRSPADLMLHITKKDLWRIEDRELKPLATGAANTARLFLRTDPKWVALTMFLISMTQIYGTRIALHVAQTRKEKAEGKPQS